MVDMLESGLILQMRRHHGMILLACFIWARGVILLVVVRIALPREIRGSFVLMGLVLHQNSLSATVVPSRERISVVAPVHE